MYFHIQKLPDWMLSNLGLDHGDEKHLPKHLHLFRLYLPRYFDKNQNLTIFAPPPLYFMQTVNKLGIKFDLDHLMSQDQVRNIDKAMKTQHVDDKKEFNDVEITHQGH